MAAFEYYALTQTIANCDLKIGMLDNACVRNDGDSTSDMLDFAYDTIQNWFTDMGGCGSNALGSEEDGLCYHTNTSTAFQS